MTTTHQITLKTLTPLWTGGVDQTCDRLHETGLIGSLRWWYEALVRGLGGFACDPTSDDRCPDENGKHCVACELFGCTGWARKFRLRVLDTSKQLIREVISANTEFILEFVELRPIQPVEKSLLVRSVEIAAKYGALGGKTTLKPQRGPLGEDYGIVEWKGASDIEMPANVGAFLQVFRDEIRQQQYPNLVHFFFFKGAFLSRLQMNSLLGLDGKGNPVSKPDEAQKFLQGKRGTAQSYAVSKKLFSFRAGGGRIWGYARDAKMRNEIIDRIKQQLGGARYTVKTGEEVLHEL